MKLSHDMNWIDLGRYVAEEMKSGKDREAIEQTMIKTLGWNSRQAHAATNPFYKEQKTVEIPQRRRKRK